MPTEPSRWDDEQVKKEASFLQSLEWGEFQKSMGLDYHLLSGEGWTCLALVRRNRFGKYIFAPYGPTLADETRLTASLKALAELAKSVEADWIKFEPMTSSSEVDLLKVELDKQARPAARKVNPPLTRIVDLTPPADQLLASISQSTRSLIRQNQRLKIFDFKTSTDPADIPIFTNMLDTVSKRKGVSFYRHEYFSKQAELLMPAKMMYLELALEKSKPIGAAIIHDFGGHSSYTYAASLPEARKTSVSALLLWQAMLNAKGRGSSSIDLFGISPEDAPQSNQWYGFSAFKRKFGGQVIERAGTWDIPVTNKYKLYRVAQSAQKGWRRH